jgi:DNA segregation ATPase FtsK/SpoIIIE, S-DNA-T family
VLAAVALLTTAVAVHDAGRRPASAVVAIPTAKVQVGTVAKTASGTVVPALGTASTAGTLLVATLAGQKNASYTGPTGWVRAVRTGQTNADAEIWYYANNPGGITSASFSTGTSSSSAGQLSEWSGVAPGSPLDMTGTTTVTLGNAATPATGAATTVAGELAVTAAAQYIAVASTVSYTPGAGWTNLGNSGATSSSYQYDADYQLGVATGTVSETMTSSSAGAWSAVVATFKPLTCKSGSLTLTSPATVAFPAVTLTGTNQTVTGSAALSPSDMSGNAAGWNVQATSSTFTNAAGRTLPTTATAVTAAAATAASGNCDLPTNSIAYPLTLPAGATAPTAVKVYTAAAGTGGGPLTLTLTFGLSVPAGAWAGTYSSTWTFTIASGP